MEIQFSIPLNYSPVDASASPSSAATGRSAGAAAARGGTFRFALESRTRHTRRSSTRARTGCSTCKKRHVKCDEAKPSCLNCIKWRGYCDGYTDPSNPRPARAETPDVKPTLIQTLDGTRILAEPAVNTLHFMNNEERAYFDEWSYLSVTFLSGGIGRSRLWTVTMPQLTLQETTLRYGAMAVGALRKACDVEREANTSTTDLMNTNKHYLNAIIYYCEALRLQSKARPSREGLRTAMLSSLLFICFEAQRGNMPATLKHVTHGFTMLNELSSCSEKAPDLVSIAPAPPALVQEILDCYKPLELQSRSFMGSYRKFFFPPKQQALPSPTEPPGLSDSSTAPSSPSQPGSPWQGGSPPSQPEPTGLPSPQSQDSPSPRSQNEQQTSASPPLAPRQRPPGIAPFTKHSPYFRPKQSNITNLEDMPAAFKTFDEAQGYWSLLQRQMVQYIPLLTQTTARLALSKVTDWNEVEVKLSSIRQHPKIGRFIDESHDWVQRWVASFDPLYQQASDDRHNNPQPYLLAINLRVEYLILSVYIAVPRFSPLEKATALTPHYQEINRLCETLISSRPNCGFAMDSGWTWPLFVSAFGCRDAIVREDAIRILTQYPIRNALRDSRIFRAIALKNRDLELHNLREGTDEEQWLRLRRRELVFEDLGTNIIFRSAQQNMRTGEWELVEEVAGFIVDAEGRLEWHRQPISESASILSGVC